MNSNFNAIENIQSGASAEFRKVSDLGINFTTPSAGNGIYAYNGSSVKSVFDFYMMNLSISNAKGYGIYLDGSAPTWGTKIENCWIEYNLGGGIYAKSQQSYFSNNFVAFNQGVGILLPTGSKRVYLLNNNVSLNYSQNFSISGSYQILLETIYIILTLENFALHLALSLLVALMLLVSRGTTLNCRIFI